jgi:hypothetical protein
MKDHSAMSHDGHANEVLALCSAVRRSGIRDAILLTLLLYALLRTSEVLAGDLPSVAGAAPKPHAKDLSQPPASAAFNAAPSSMPSLPANFAAPASFEFESFSPTEFRPRVHDSTFAGATRTSSLGMDSSMFQSNSVWDQMHESRSADRVRLLTLWQTRASSLSLQAKRGGPSLQWSSPWMMRDKSSRGLLDRWVPMPFRSSPGTPPRSGPVRPTSSVGTPRAFDAASGVAAK